MSGLAGPAGFGIALARRNISGSTSISVIVEWDVLEAKPHSLLRYGQPGNCEWEIGMLQIIFGDDEHTAADGPYARLMKTRKWLYLSSAASLAVSGGLYNEPAATALVKIVKLPTSIIAPSLVIGIVYLLVQYTSLIGQLISTYDIVLTDRFTFRRSDELASARERVSEARKQLNSSVSAFRQNYTLALDVREKELLSELSAETKSLKAMEEKRVHAEKNRSEASEIAKLRHSESRQKAIRAGVTNSLRKLKADTLAELDPSYDPNVRLAEDALLEARQALDILRYQVPSERKGYKLAEIIIDLIRIIPPVIIATLALLHFFNRWPFNG